MQPATYSSHVLSDHSSEFVFLTGILNRHNSCPDVIKDKCSFRAGIHVFVFVLFAPKHSDTS